VLALDSAVGLSFLRGMFATVNPCGFVLLPTYLVYFLGIESVSSAANPRASIGRALAVGAAVSAGFMAVFVAVGVFTSFVDTWLVANSKYVTVVIGATFVVLGTAMLAGYRPRFATPRLDPGPRERTVESMFVYGVAYAVASLGCTIGLFLPTIVRGREDGFVTGVLHVGAYGLGMALVVTGLTVSLAVASQALLRVLRAAMRHVDLLAAALMVLSGLYLIWYFVVVDIQGETDSITGAVQRWQERTTQRLNDQWEVAALVLGGTVVAAVLYVVRRRSTGPHDAAPTGSDRRELISVVSPGGDVPGAE
jgi:cytochrome c biogenesis protein CcdA